MVARLLVKEKMAAKHKLCTSVLRQKQLPTINILLYVKLENIHNSCFIYVFNFFSGFQTQCSVTVDGLPFPWHMVNLLDIDMYCVYYKWAMLLEWYTSSIML